MGLREALFLPVIGALCLAAPFWPRIGLYGYLWFGLMRPDLLAFAEGKYPYSLALALCTAIGASRYVARATVWLRNPFCLWLLVLQLPVGLSVLAAVQPELSFERYQAYIRMILVLLLIPLLIAQVEDCRRLLLVAAASLGLLALKFGVYGVVHGGAELNSGYGEMLADNNFLALALAMTIPLAWHCRAFTSSSLIRALWVGVIGAAMAGIVMTGSRGGSIAMLAGLLFVFLRNRRNLVPLLVIAAFLAGAVYLVQDRYLNRMETLENVHAEASAESRLLHASIALKMASDYPLLGVGFGGFNYAALAPRYMDEYDPQLLNHVAHNSYLQMLVDSGIFAFLLYGGLLARTIIWLGRSAARMRELDPAYEAIPLAIQGALIVFAVGSTFYSCQRMDLPYIFLMAAAAWRTIEPTMIAPNMIESTMTNTA
ncbi:MAG TPA: putative O-glycosylation ligase, exosortase A system-associated [Bryobacteraceae bacterium]|nr:putative O-glycosylation ligase, exosortase A system-associated [Bryobacteraceae bacterium]